MSAAVPIRCCLPTPRLADALAPVPDVETMVWDGTGATPAGLSDVSVLVPPYAPRPMAPEALAQMPRLALVQLLSAGSDGWPELLAPGVTLCGGQGIHGASTAELALCGLLMTWHHSVELLDRQRSGRWQPIRGGTAQGRSVVVLGAGDIASVLARQLRSLGAEPALVGRHGRDGVHGVEEPPELVSRCDALVAAVPLNGSTRGMVDSALLRRIPDGGCVVNVARGGVVRTDDLVAEVRTGRLRAVLDVVDPEPLPAGHELWRLPNVILTPHVGGGADGWPQRAAGLVRAQLTRLRNGEPPAHIVRG